ncbi:MAG: LysE family translocator [Rhodococcus sp. (in: high G+C Gram-positive bacteria)]|uniref:LysE family translocator n=1 Tax=Rhodococcus sp. TaxID=1831 RepID=UPI003BB7C379
METYSRESFLVFPQDPNSRFVVVDEECEVVAIGAVVAFWAVSFLFVLTPGADWAYAITAGLRHRAVLPAVGGMLSGHLLMTAIVAAGVAALVAGTPTLMTVLTIAGAVYLLWLGAVMLTRPASPVQAAESGSSQSWVRQAVTGLGVSGLNPKVLLLFVALLPQFTDSAGSWPVAMQIVVLGVVHTVSCAVVYTGVGTGARVVLRARPTAARAVTTVSGVAMIVLGSVLLLERLTV